MKHSRGRGLIIVTDCHSSGQWVRQCAEFLDEQGVKPCGHSAMEKGVLLRVAASCEASQYSAELVYTTQGMELEKDGHIHFPPGKQLGRRQHTFVVDFTVVRCGKGENERCSISVDATWSTAGEVIDHPQFLLGQSQSYSSTGLFTFSVCFVQFLGQWMFQVSTACNIWILHITSRRMHLHCWRAEARSKFGSLRCKTPPSTSSPPWWRRASRSSAVSDSRRCSAIHRQLSLVGFCKSSSS